MKNLDSTLKNRDITFPTKVHIVNGMVFPVVIYGWESWTIKKTDQRIDAFSLWCWRTLESPLDCKEIKPVSRKGNQSWIFIGRTDAETEAPILWPPDANSWLIGKVPDAKKDWGQEEKGVTENEMFGRHHRLNGHEVEQTLGNRRTGKPGMLQSMGSQSQTWLSNWATTKQLPGWLSPGAKGTTRNQSFELYYVFKNKRSDLEHSYGLKILVRDIHCTEYNE